MALNWGIIGPGRIAHRFATALTQGTDGKLIAVASRNEQRASEFAHEFSAERYYTQYSALVEDSDIDVIYIATPHNFHFEQAVMCLHAGKHLLIEKPICMNALQAQKIADLAAQKNRFVMEAVWSRFLPSCQQAMQWLVQGQIGQLRAIDSSICFAFDKGDDHRTFNKALAGGALLDLGIYSVNLSQWFAKANPVNISAMAKIGHTGVDNILMSNMRYANGIMAQFTTAMEARSTNYLLLQGSKGTIELQDMFWAGHKVTLINDDKTVTMNLPHAVNGFEYQIQEVQNCIENNEMYSNIMPITDTLANMQVMDNIRQQIELDYGELENS